MAGTGVSGPWTSRTRWWKNDRVSPAICRYPDDWNWPPLREGGLPHQRVPIGQRCLGYREVTALDQGV